MNETAATVKEGYQADKKFAAEMVRASDSKLHNVAAFLGGIASQEVIKLLIKQYTVFNGTLVYDGIVGKLQAFK
jgi:amyloid beta precursor protein binding protein 1